MSVNSPEWPELTLQTSCLTRCDIHHRIASPTLLSLQCLQETLLHRLGHLAIDTDRLESAYGFLCDRWEISTRDRPLPAISTVVKFPDGELLCTFKADDNLSTMVLGSLPGHTNSTTAIKIRAAHESMAAPEAANTTDARVMARIFRNLRVSMMFSCIRSCSEVA